MGVKVHSLLYFMIWIIYFINYHVKLTRKHVINSKFKMNYENCLISNLGISLFPFVCPLGFIYIYIEKDRTSHPVFFMFEILTK